MNAQDNRYQDFLDHFGVLNPLGIAKNLLDCWVNFGSLRLYQFKLAFDPLLNFLQLTAVLQLINFLLHLKVLALEDLEHTPRPLDFEGSLVPHLLDGLPEILYP